MVLPGMSCLSDRHARFSSEGIYAYSPQRWPLFYLRGDNSSAKEGLYHVTAKLSGVPRPIAVTTGDLREHDITYENSRYFDARVQLPGWLNCKRMLVSLILSFEILFVRLQPHTSKGVEKKGRLR